MASPRTSSSTPAMRQARRAWNLLHVDSAQAGRLAERAREKAAAAGDTAAEAWAWLTLGLHRLYYGTADEAMAALQKARRRLTGRDQRGAQVLVEAMMARALWRQGRFQDALDLVLPLRTEAVRLLRDEQRGLVLNTIAGCYSSLGRSDEAFAYMFRGLRDAAPSRGRGFDTVLHCNLSHELMEIGDYEQALDHVEQGLARCQHLKNPRLRSILWINRIISLTELGRAADAMDDVSALRAMPADESGRGRMAAHYEVLAIAASLAGDTVQARELLGMAEAVGPPTLPDDRLERVTAHALLALAEGRPAAALRALEPEHALARDNACDGLSTRVRVRYFDTLAAALERAGKAKAALAALRECQGLQRRQAQLASRARYQAAALQTELLRLQHDLDEKQAAQRASERASSALMAVNAELSVRIEQVQALQQALRQQATQDPLTGLFNRRHLNDSLPTLFALAQRERQPLAVAILDMDHFKAVNDVHGHAVGDRLLTAFGELLAGQCRASDVACRYGGEEFCLLMPRTDAAGARRKVQALLKRWRAQHFEIGAGKRLERLSFSAGVADTDETGPSPDALLRTADDRLLKAKREGRSRVLAA